MQDNGFKTMSTPFDNASVPMIKELGLDYLKIASCSFGDWPLHEEIAKVDIPIIASTAGATTQIIDNVVSFFTHRQKDFMLMHCVGEYPTKPEFMNLNQIDYLKNRYKNIEIGLSTHEEPNNYDLVKMAVAKGVKVYEKHVGLPTEKYPINAYSVSPEQFSNWLMSMKEAFIICGDGSKRVLDNTNELKTLQELRRGVCAKFDLKAGDILTSENVVFTFPPEENQLSANEFSKYIEYKLTQDVPRNKQIYKTQLTQTNKREQILDIVKQVKQLIKNSNVVIPNECELEISHHYGLDKFYKYGICMITVINREYCKKLIIILPNQTHPEQYHKIKEESFNLLYGDLLLELDGKRIACKVGDVQLVKPNIKHKFSSKNGAIIEEISSTHIKDDSYYSDPSIMQNKNRKTIIRFWIDV
jgi:sialic acid synthase SpsE/D-lyxose ketol-isomerase